MPNDAKLGFLVGVAGVVVAAVVFVQNPPPAVPQTASGATVTTTAAPPPAATPTNPGPLARVAVPAATTSVSGTRKEVEGQTTSRHGSDEDE